MTNLLYITDQTMSMSETIQQRTHMHAFNDRLIKGCTYRVPAVATIFTPLFLLTVTPLLRPTSPLSGS